MSDQADGPPAEGWYSDPQGQADLRWWDGSSWTDHTSRREPPPGPADPFRRWLTLGAIAAVAVGSFLPWATVTAPLTGRITVSGLEGDGVFTLILAGVAAFLASPLLKNDGLNRSHSLGVVIIGGLVSGTGGLAYVRIDGLAGDGLVLNQVGIGLGMVLAGGVALLIAGALSMSANKPDG